MRVCHIVVGCRGMIIHSASKAEAFIRLIVQPVPGKLKTQDLKLKGHLTGL